MAFRYGGRNSSIEKSIEKRLRGQKAATVTVLDRIASGLGLSPAALVAQAADDRVTIRRATEQDMIDEPGGWRRTILTQVVPGVNFEWIRVTLPAGCDPGWSV